MIRIEKSIYDNPEPSDGKRILVTRLWPRGISKDRVDLWMKDLGTERDLIKKWKGGVMSWDSFAAEYNGSLRGKESLLRELARQSKAGTITLLCTDKDPRRCHRSLLKAAVELLAP